MHAFRVGAGKYSNKVLHSAVVSDAVSVGNNSDNNEQQTSKQQIVCAYVEQKRRCKAQHADNGNNDARFRWQCFNISAGVAA